MKVRFENSQGDIMTGEVIGRGYYDVDQPECYQVKIDNINHSFPFVPISKCEVVK